MMFGIRRLAVLDGRVECPLRGWDDAERCLACPWLSLSRSASGRATIWCRPMLVSDRYAGVVTPLRPD